jgi:hypothetical protein
MIILMSTLDVSGTYTLTDDHYRPRSDTGGAMASGSTVSNSSFDGMPPTAHRRRTQHV